MPLCPCNTIISTDQESAVNIVKKCLRTDNLSIKLPIFTIRREDFFFCGGSDSLYKVSRLLKLFEACTQVLKYTFVISAIPVLSSTFPAKLPFYCIALNYCYYNHNQYWQHKEEKYKQAIPK